MQTEEAYELIAQDLYAVVEPSHWDCARVTTKVFTRMTESSYSRQFNGDCFENERFPSLRTAGPASKAALFLRDNLLQTTGQRIWALTFTLYPDGKFNIDYDYNKPEGYEESDDVITGDEINASLTGLISHKKPAS